MLRCDLPASGYVCTHIHHVAMSVIKMVGCSENTSDSAYDKSLAFHSGLRILEAKMLSHYRQQQSNYVFKGD